MHGYLRRKVTYNLGKGGGSGNTTASGGHGDKPKTIEANPFYWFTARSPTETGSRHIIVDGSQEFTIDKEYRDIGESEGWLRYIGCIRDRHGRVTYRYSID